MQYSPSHTVFLRRIGTVWDGVFWFGDAMRPMARRIAFLLCFVSVAFATDSPAIREVQARYAECVALEKNRGARRVEFERGLAGNDLGPWKKRPSGLTDVYEYMVVYVLNGRVRSAGLEQSSPSGDWVSFTTYCFRTDGSLAFQYQVLNTFHSTANPGPLRVEVRSYFNPTGRRLEMRTRLLDIKTLKPIKADYLAFEPPAFPTSASVVKAVGWRLLPAR